MKDLKLNNLHIVVAGLPKTGTTALFFSIKNALKDKKCKFLFEPSKYEFCQTDREIFILAKIIFWFGRKNADYDSWKEFDKKILIVRDPRDRMVSNFLYGIRHSNFYDKKEKFNLLMDTLRKKEKDPESISLLDLYQLRTELSGFTFSKKSFFDLFRGHSECFMDFHRKNEDYFLIKYENFIDKNFSNLEKYLSFSISETSTVPLGLKRVERTKGYGDWKNWFTKDDVDFFKPLFKDYMEKYKYDFNDWLTNEDKKIEPEFCSLYVERIIEEKQEEDKHKNNSVLDANC
jgi:hypothetical protein